MKRKITASVNGYDRYTREVTVIASTPNPVRAFDEDGKPILESLVGWDLERFLDNPVACVFHNTYWFPVGKAIEYETTNDGGLRLRIKLRAAGRSEIVDELAGCLEDDMIRAVSVGFEPGESKRNADGTWTRRNNNLLEISFVTVPADEDALVTPSDDATKGEEGDEETVRKRVSDAAREMAKARARVRAKRSSKGGPSVRTDGVDQVRHFDTVGRLGKVDRTSIGGARIPARLSRVGVLTYRNGDGTTRRELRLPEEVFKADSLATLEDVPVIDWVDHKRIHGTTGWRDVARGHVKTARQDGKFIDSVLVVQDAETLDSIDSGDRTEISCGYVCKLEHAPGVWNGEAYDFIQRDIRYDHVALCPPNGGRAGPEVGLRLDANTWGVSHLDNEDVMKMIRLDGKDYEFGSQAHMDAQEAIHQRALTKAVGDATGPLQAKLDAADKARIEAEKARDAAQGACDAAKTALEQVKLDATKAQQKAEEAEKERAKSFRSNIRSKVRLLNRISRFFGDEDEEDEEDEEKMDAKLDARLDMLDKEGGEREIMLTVITKANPKFDSKDKSDDYVRAHFDMTLEQATSSRKDGKSINGVTRAATTLEKRDVKLDAIDENDPMFKATKAHDDWANNAHKTPAAAK